MSYDVVHVQDGALNINNIKDLIGFLKKLNKINNFLEFFDEWPIEESDYDGEGRYELTHHNNGKLDCDDIMKLLEKIVKLCEKYGQSLDITVKVFDDGMFLMYLYIVENEICDVSLKINKYMSKIETRVKG